MSKSNIRDHRAYSDAIAERISDRSLPAALKAPLKNFLVARAAFEKAAGTAFKAREARDIALQLVANADDILDPAVDALATALVGAGITKRTRPFAGLSSYGPRELQDLGYASEPGEVRKLVANVMKKKPAAAVVKACQACTKAAAGVEAALKKVVKPEAEYRKSLVTRDALLPALVKATSKLKLHAQLAWEDEPATYKAIFAPPDTVQAPKKRATKKTQAAKKTGAKSTANGVTTTTPGT
jgi:hypothetical protein